MAVGPCDTEAKVHSAGLNPKVKLRRKKTCNETTPDTSLFFFHVCSAEVEMITKVISIILRGFDKKKIFF